MVLAQALEVGSNSILGHSACFLQRIALGDQSRESGQVTMNPPSSAGSNSTVCESPLRSCVPAFQLQRYGNFDYGDSRPQDVSNMT